MFASETRKVFLQRLPIVHGVRAVDQWIDARVGHGEHEQSILHVLVHVVHFLLVKVEQQHNGRVRGPTPNESQYDDDCHAKRSSACLLYLGPVRSAQLELAFVILAVFRPIYAQMIVPIFRIGSLQKTASALSIYDQKVADLLFDLFRHKFTYLELCF